MKVFAFGLLASLAGGVWTFAFAEAITPSKFDFKPGPIEALQRNEVYSAWNANDPKDVLKPGLKVIFYGRGIGCDLKAKNGPVSNNGGPQYGRADALTGIPFQSDGKGARRTPSAQTYDCDISIRDQLADSFVHFNEVPESGGVGLFTYTGPSDTAERTFFRQVDKSGMRGLGPNANIGGTFVTFRFNWSGRQVAFPWGTGNVQVDRRTAQIRTKQSVVVVNAGGSGAVMRSGGPIQAKQQTTTSFINLACMREPKQPGKLCQLQYLFNLAVFREGVTDWTQVKWAHGAALLLDPGQSGNPVVHGFVPQLGKVVLDRKYGLEIYSSAGEATKHQLFKDAEFKIDITFAQLKNALRLIAAKIQTETPASLSDSQMARTFGEHWNNPSEWALLSVNVSQEVHNPTDSAKAFIGGGMRELSVEEKAP